LICPNTGSTTVLRKALSRVNQVGDQGGRAGDDFRLRRLHLSVGDLFVDRRGRRGEGGGVIWSGAPPVSPQGRPTQLLLLVEISEALNASLFHSSSPMPGCRSGYLRGGTTFGSVLDGPISAYQPHPALAFTSQKPLSP
jgi:hypothetical protein